MSIKDFFQNISMMYLKVTILYLKQVCPLSTLMIAKAFVCAVLYVLLFQCLLMRYSPSNGLAQQLIRAP